MSKRNEKECFDCCQKTHFRDFQKLSKNSQFGHISRKMGQLKFFGPKGLIGVTHRKNVEKCNFRKFSDFIFWKLHL
jgi:hypothetical protein